MKLCRKGLHDLDKDANCVPCYLPKRVCWGCHKERNRVAARQRRKGQGRELRAACSQGHALTPDNIDNPKTRRCLICRARRTRNKHLMRAYGITIDHYDMLLAFQEGRCAICGRSETSHSSGYLSVDHNHDTNEVRGLLCHGCNVGIGYFYENPETLRKAIEYLEAERALIHARELKLG